MSNKICFKSIGASKAKTVLYLPNSPDYYPNFDPAKPDIPQLILDNGNHWRKIFTIFAKLCCEQDFRSYRDHKLLQHNESICFADQLADEKAIHIIAGKASWLRMGFNFEQFIAIDDQGRAFYRGNVLLVPYPDYRQFSNALVEKVRAVMRTLCSWPEHD